MKWTKEFKRSVKEFLDKFKCHHCGGDLSYFNAGVYSNPSLEAIYECQDCGEVSRIDLEDCNGCKDCKSVPIEQVLAENRDEVEPYLEDLADRLEPKSHCCECVSGERHAVHIQYPNCECKFEEVEVK